MSEVKSQLLTDEWALLAALGLKTYQQDEPLAIDSSKLLDDALCLATLQKIQPEIGAPNLKITASLVMKRVAFLTLAPVLYSMSRFDKGLNATLENSVFEYPLKNRLWLSKMPLKSTSISICRSDRDAWRESVLTAVFSGNLSLLVEQFYALTKVPKCILWENIAVRVFSIYERRILMNISEEIRAQAQSDYEFLLDTKTSALFGLDENPLTRFHRKTLKTALSDEAVRVRRTCCYYYQATQPSEYCSNCPLPLKKMKKLKKM